MPLLRSQAEQALLRVVPPSMDAELGQTDVAFLWPPQIGITYSDVTLTARETGTPTNLERLTLGVEPFSLLKGKPVFSSINVGGLDLSVLKGQSEQLPPLKIGALHGAFSAISGQIQSIGSQFLYQEGGATINIEDISINLPQNGYSQTIEITAMDITANEGAADIEGEMVIDGYNIPVNGRITVIAATQDNELELVEDVRVSLTARGFPMPWRRLQTIVSDDETDHTPEARPSPLLADITIEALDTSGEAQDRLEVGVVPRDMAFKLAINDFVPVRGRFTIAADFATPAITLKPDNWQVGGSQFLLNGRFRDAQDAARGNAYDFDVLANRGVISAGDSPSNPLKFAARARGVASLDDRLIQYSKLEINSEGGEVTGRGDLTLGGDFPTAVLEIVFNDMSIGGVKQLWPAPIARGARTWVLNNLAGGRITTGRFDVSEPLRRRIPGTDKYLTGATTVDLTVDGVRFDVAGDIPPVRDANGRVSFRDGVTRVSLDQGTLFLPTGRKAQASDGQLTIFPADENDGKIRASLDMAIAGEAKAVGELITFNPINANQFYAFNPGDLSGDVNGNVKVDFLLNGEKGPQPNWSVDFKVANAGSATKIEGRQLDQLNGRIQVDPRRAEFDLKGRIDDLPADIAMVIPFGNSGVSAKRDISLRLSTNDRKKIAPGLETILTGNTPVKVSGSGNATQIEADLTSAKLDLPWIVWAKGSGIRSGTVFNLLQQGGLTSLTNFKLTGNSFGVNNGRIDVDNVGLKNARFGFAQLSKDDNFTLDMKRHGAGYAITIGGKSLDARAMMRYVRAQARSTASDNGSTPVDVTANIGRVQGFHGEHLNNVKISLRVRGGTVTRFTLAGTSKDGFPIFLTLEGAGSGRTIEVEALNAGAFLRFADIYTNVRGGNLNVALRGTGPQSLSGKADIFDFRVFNEPKLAQLVSSKSGNSQSLEQAVNRQIDTREVKFERASSNLVFKPGRLDITEAVARGPLAGFSVQGKVFDGNNQTRLTGTFLPAYGLNSLFADIPILGVLLGNGRDRGLIGVTFKLDGSFDNPNVTVNPLSVIAPGVFRSIFEFR